MSNFETDAIGHVVTADELTFDEATIIREQERLAVEKKKKKRKKIRNIILLILLLIILAVVAWYFIWGKKMLTTAADNTVKIEKTETQSITFVKVNSINGNEIDYTVLEEKVETEETEPSRTTGETPSTDRQMPTGGSNQGGSAPEGFDPSSFGGQGGSAPEGFDPSSFGGQGGSAPEGFDPSSFGGQGGNMPSGFDPSNFGGFGSSDGSGMPSGFDASSFGGFGGSQSGSGSSGSSSKRTNGTTLTYDGKTYRMTEETKVEYIPVGTDVTTKLGTKTTFSRISAGDCLALVTETINGEVVIMAVYIVG